LARPLESSAVCSCALLGVCLILFFYCLGDSELWRTESLRAIIAQQMLDTGDWIVPRLYGEPLFTKPPGMYLAIVLCSLPVGRVTEFTARLPSALAATGCVLMFFWYFHRQIGRSAGFVGALTLPMSLMWLDKASSAEIDTLQVFWVAASLLCFFRAIDGDQAGSFVWWLVAMLCVAGGILTKWTAAEFFYGTAIPYLWWRGRLRILWGWQHLTGLAIAAVICLAWIGAAVHREGWDIFWVTVEREGGDRLIPQHGGRPYPWGETLLHPAKLIITTLPWSLLALWSLRPSFSRLLRDPERRVWQGMHCWVWPQMLFWSLPTEHTPRHSFPLFPGLAGLAALVWLTWHDGRLTWKLPPRWAPRTLACSLAVWLVLKLAFVHVVMPKRTDHREARIKGALIASLVPVGEILYLFMLKDEGIMFYYGRPVLRLHSAEELASLPGPVYCILTEEEWDDWEAPWRAEPVQRLTDEQGAPLVLVRVW
jgi:4-amino-4-deoxy-L-arabinose transferase-like glycosyltransferase